MRAGDLNKIIMIQCPMKTPDGMGGWVTTFVAAATVFAQISPVTAREQVWGMQTVMTISHKITIRYRSVLKASWRIKYGNSFYNIVSIINVDMANDYLEIMCKEATA
jgi:SPP1 family predicted phage head-tail adaptor